MVVPTCETVVLTSKNVDELAERTHWTPVELWRMLWEAQGHFEPVLFCVPIIQTDETHICRGEN